MSEHTTTRGYVEGYYGRLLDWPERRALLSTLEGLGMNAYAYAPKEDARHRLRWREPYDAAWRSSFVSFCRDAAASGVDVIAGMAPGIDFDFASLGGGPDLESLRVKFEGLREGGAARLMLLMDDIDADFHTRAGGVSSEGEAHALLANRLGDLLDASLVVVPRIYATELAVGAPDYLPDFARTLDARHAVSVCGHDIVAREVRAGDCGLQEQEGGGRETILWDNLYANDYCPRRLFVGPWCGRDGIDAVLLNATGMPETDRLLLALMAVGLTRGTTGEASDDSGADEEAFAVLERHGVPATFRLVADAFRHPTTNDRLGSPLAGLRATPKVLAALDELLWRWKTSLSREWYPYLMGLRQDVLLAEGMLPPDRIRKTQLAPLARTLLGNDH